MGYRLGVDLGTTYTAAAVDVDGRVELLGLGIRAMQVPSVVFVREDGEIIVGEAAEQQGAADPDRVVRQFKRRIGDPVPFVVGGSPYSAQALTARLLAWVVEVATARHGGPPEHVCVTHPANWGPFKLDLLAQAVQLAGLGGVPTSTCTEPEAAAIAYASRDRVAEGERVAVYDLGGGTFDAAVLVREGAGFRLAGPPEGVEHLGGVDFDEAVLQHVLAALGDDVAGLDDSDPAVLVGLNRLRRDCVEAKEVLSSDVDTVVSVALPGITRTVRLTRAELNDMLRPAVGETVAATARVLESADVGPQDLSAIVMVGGSSRIPLVSELLSTAFERPLAMDNHPKHDVALGAALRGAPVDPPAAAEAPSAPRSRRIRVPSLLVAGVLAVAAVGSVLVAPLWAETVYSEAVDAAGAFPPFVPGNGSPGAEPAVPPVRTVAAVTGDTPGLYGGTRSNSCDAQAIRTHLDTDPAKAAAWASAMGLRPADIGPVLASLTPLTLRTDTAVTNHGFRDGRPTPFQSVLQAGTAVLVDPQGLPRVRCYCGNPLAEPDRQSAIRYADPAWDGFSEDAVTVITRAPGEVHDFVVVAPGTDQVLTRPRGTGGEQDRPADPRLVDEARRTFDSVAGGAAAVGPVPEASVPGAAEPTSAVADTTVPGTTVPATGTAGPSTALDPGSAAPGAGDDPEPLPDPGTPEPEVRVPLEPSPVTPEPEAQIHVEPYPGTPEPEAQVQIEPE